MLPGELGLSIGQVKEELKRLRHGQGLAHPASVMMLSPPVRAAVLGRQGDNPLDAVQLTARLAALLDDLSEHERQYARVDLNLDDAHSYPTLTERQESLAAELKCAGKTVRRHSDEALETLALLIASRDREVTSVGGEGRPASVDLLPAREIARFWGIRTAQPVEIVCSEIPERERPEFADPADRNYLRYAKFADLDSLIYVRTRLAQLFPDSMIRDFAPSEYHDAQASVLIVIGGPPWNAKYREFLPQLPYHFEPHPLGEDDPLVIPQLSGLTMGPSWTERHELLEDLAIFTRLTLVQGTRVFLLGGCLTLGVLGAARCFLHGIRGAENIAYMTELVDDQDFVLVTEVSRIGGIVDMADLPVAKPLLLLARDPGAPFAVIVNNTDRYRGTR